MMNKLLNYHCDWFKREFDCFANSQGVSDMSGDMFLARIESIWQVFTSASDWSRVVVEGDARFPCLHIDGKRLMKQEG